MTLNTCCTPSDLGYLVSIVMFCVILLTLPLTLTLALILTLTLALTLTLTLTRTLTLTLTLTLSHVRLLHNPTRIPRWSFLGAD